MQIWARKAGTEDESGGIERQERLQEGDRVMGVQWIMG